MHQTLYQLDVPMDLLGRARFIDDSSSRLLRSILHRFGYSPSTDGVKAVKRAASCMEKDLLASDSQLVFAPVASRYLPFIQTDLPIVYLSDTTSKLYCDYYPEAKTLSLREIDLRHHNEQESIRKSAHLVYSSRWAADSAIKHFGANQEKISVIPFGANVDDIPEPEEAIIKPFGNSCRLLFIGKNWFRKGGSIAIDTVVALNEMGINAELSVIGPGPKTTRLPSSVTVFGILDKRKTRHRLLLKNLFNQSHFLILPSRADCTPIVCGEANAFAMPVIGANTGGLPDVVEDGLNGYLLPESANGTQYAEKIAQVWPPNDKYFTMCKLARETYDRRLNWGAWGRQIVDVFSRLT